MTTFLIPIEGLTLSCEWSVGPVRLLPADDVPPLDAMTTALRTEWFATAVKDLRAGAVAEVGAHDLDEALDVAGQAIDVLRVFQHVRYYTTRLTQFGLPGDVRHGIVPYAIVERDRSGHGFSTHGEIVGWSFPDPQLWLEADAFRWVGATIAASSPTEGGRRALVGVRLLSQALVEQRPTLKMVQLVTAREAWLLPRKGGGQTYRLARSVAFFGCGRHDNNLCGRSRDTCPYLALDPATDRAKLRILRTKGINPPWRCAEWHRVVDWYEMRSEVVHGAGPTLTMQEVSNSLYWVMKYLAEPILSFLQQHATAPIAALESELHALPAMPDWEARLGRP